MSGPNIRNRGTRFRARRWWRAPCVLARNDFPVGNYIINHDVKHWWRSALLEKHFLWIIDQLRRQNQSRVSDLTTGTAYLLLVLTNSKTKNQVCVN